MSFALQLVIRTAGLSGQEDTVSVSGREPWLLENVVGVGKLPGAEVNKKAGWY